MDSDTSCRLQAALQEETAAQNQVAQVQQRLAAAQEALAQAQADRAAMISAAANGKAVDPKLASAAIADAEFNIAVLSEASGIAAERLEAAIDALNIILASIVQAKAAQARAEYQQACRDFERAAETRNEKSALMASLQRAADGVTNAKMLLHARSASTVPVGLGHTLNQHLADLELDAARRGIESASDTLRRLCDAEIAAASHP